MLILSLIFNRVLSLSWKINDNNKEKYRFNLGKLKLNYILKLLKCKPTYNQI